MKNILIIWTSAAIVVIRTTCSSISFVCHYRSIIRSLSHQTLPAFISRSIIDQVKLILNVHFFENDVQFRTTIEWIISFSSRAFMYIAILSFKILHSFKNQNNFLIAIYFFLSPDDCLISKRLVLSVHITVISVIIMSVFLIVCFPPLKIVYCISLWLFIDWSESIVSLMILGRCSSEERRTRVRWEHRHRSSALCASNPTIRKIWDLEIKFLQFERTVFWRSSVTD